MRLLARLNGLRPDDRAVADRDAGHDERDDFPEHRPIDIGNAAAAQACGLPQRALQELQGALQELFECDRVLSSLLMQGEPAQSE